MRHTPVTEIAAVAAAALHVSYPPLLPLPPDVPLIHSCCAGAVPQRWGARR